MGDYKLIRGHPGEYDGYHPAIVGQTCDADPRTNQIPPQWNPIGAAMTSMQWKLKAM